MKHLFTLIVVCNCFLTARAESDTILTYSNVQRVDSTIAKDELFSRARVWFTDAFKNSNEVVQVEDKEAGQIIGKGTMRYNTNVFMGSAWLQGWIRFTVKIQVKDGRYKYSFTSFTHEGTPNSQTSFTNFGIVTSAVECPESNCPSSIGPRGWRNNVWNDLKATINGNVPALVKSLVTAMSVPATKDEW